MMITTAIQKGSIVYVYGDGNRQLFNKTGELHGYTSSTVSIRKGNVVYTYNERGSQVGSSTTR